MKRLVDIVLILAVSLHAVDGGCTFAEHKTALNACMSTATGGTSTWGFPFGTIAEQATMCLAASQSTLQTCVETVFSAASGCNTDAKTLKVFGMDGANIVTAISNLCSNTLISEAQACMSTATLATYTTAETAFNTNVDALPSAASQLEMCGLLTTLKYQAYDVILTAQCVDSTHLAVWSSFYTTLVNTYGCDGVVCSSATVTSVTQTVPLLFLALTVLTDSFIS